MPLSLVNADSSAQCDRPFNSLSGRACADESHRRKGTNTLTQPETNPPPATVTTPPPQPPAPAPTTPPVVVPAQQQSPGIGESMSTLAQHVASLPERIVDALRESTPKPPESAPATAPANAPATAPAGELPPAGDTRNTRQRFLDGWFGKGRY